MINIKQLEVALPLPLPRRLTGARLALHDPRYE